MEAGHEDIGVRQIHLPTPDFLQHWRQLEGAPTLRIEQGCENAGSVEAWPAPEVNGSVIGDQRRCALVANDAMRLDGMRRRSGDHPRWRSRLGGDPLNQPFFLKPG
jgi:hypothetical protein